MQPLGLAHLRLARSSDSLLRLGEIVEWIRNLVVMIIYCIMYEDEHNGAIKQIVFVPFCRTLTLP